MRNPPYNCATCPYESSCDTAFHMPDCRFYYTREKDESIVAQLKNLFGKFFK